MTNNGKTLEKTIQLIEETFKDSESTQVLRNHKIKSVSGGKREIDVLIKTNVNGYEICIAIECKDYKTKVSGEKIEAFNSKCSLIKEINKMIFVSSNGFQSGAISSAKQFGIELITANKLSVEYINSLIPPIKELNIKILPELKNRVIRLDEKNKDSYDVLIKTFKGILIDNQTKKSYYLDYFFWNEINIQKYELQKIAMLDWMKVENKNDKEIIIPITCTIEFKDFYIEDDLQNKISIIEGSCDIDVMFTYKYLATTGRIIKHADESIKAHSINIKMDNESETELILKPNDEFDIYLTEDKNTIKLEKLFKYNPKTNEITIP